ncbi:Oidioi.mRNA.OKI2018_I69.chr2.g5505.t1.cds [Oikopleura dioica]|uniref:Palmitoyltransferase n=1 Tax=Oikopleura dioica TaxID=34765 RepID=A0ABN7T6G8_OIKDI|nr:Oidioi.mRNA.OKI2018_I69.chr2.g5505.t1.cds [Oikopleura dioica]
MTPSGLKWRGSERLSSLYRSALQNSRYLKFVLASLTTNAAYSDVGEAILENVMVPIGRFAEKNCKRFGFLFIFLVVGMVSFVNYVYFVYMRRIITDFDFFFGLFVNLHMLFNYFNASFRDPGYTSSRSYFSSRNCSKCLFPKPTGSHHCSVCAKCVIQMDHHCPWINNCVGHFNRRYFFNFCLWTTIGCGYFSLVGYPYLRWSEWPSRKIYRRFDSAFYLCLLITLALGALTAYHMLLISKDQTTLQRMRPTKAPSPRSRCFENWLKFYNIRTYAHFFTRFLIPSTHLPIDSGVPENSSHAALLEIV